jgi:hypothetical protein
MADVLRSGLLFRRSRRWCSSGGCVEVALLPDGSAVVRDSTDRMREPLMFTKQEWSYFVSWVKTGKFDL